MGAYADEDGDAGEHVERPEETICALADPRDGENEEEVGPDGGNEAPAVGVLPDVSSEGARDGPFVD
jgi:hypothetical protein